MHTCSEYDPLALRHVFLVLLGSDGEHVALIACERFTQQSSLNVLLLDRICHYQVKFFTELCVSVWIRIRKKDVVIGILKVVAEGESVQ